MVAISGDKREGRASERWAIADASAEEVGDLLNRLDAEQYTLAKIHPGAEEFPYLMVGGGAGQYIVYAVLEEGDVSWTLLRRTRGVGRVELVAGAQLGSYDVATIVDRDQMMSAARVFLASGDLDPTQPWRRDGAP